MTDFFTGEIHSDNLTDEELSILTPYLTAMLRLGDRDENTDQVPSEDLPFYDGTENNGAEGK